MDNTGAKSEGAAYLTAVNIKEGFLPKAKDFLPDHLDATVVRVSKTHDEMESQCEKLTTEELQKEFFHLRKELKNYLVVLKSIQDIKSKNQEMWPVVAFFLDPEVDVQEPPMEKQQQARKMLQRFAGFSTHSTEIVNKLIQKRLDFEAEKVRLQMEARKKKSSGSVSGFLNKLGIKF